jgi:Anaerobic c4-dicarboxylate membrane transporter
MADDEISALAGLEPRRFWGHFEALSKIARPSRREERVIEHVRRWAAGNGLAVREDAARNLVIDAEYQPRIEAGEVQPPAPAAEIELQPYAKRSVMIFLIAVLVICVFGFVEELRPRSPARTGAPNRCR